MQGRLNSIHIKTDFEDQAKASEVMKQVQLGSTLLNIRNQKHQEREVDYFQNPYTPAGISTLNDSAFMPKIEERKTVGRSSYITINPNPASIQLERHRAPPTILLDSANPQLKERSMPVHALSNNNNMFSIIEGRRSNLAEECHSSYLNMMKNKNKKTNGSMV